MQRFIPKLQDHLLGRLLGREFDGDTNGEFSDRDRNTIRMMGNRIYAVNTCRVNYTTYDVRRDQERINPRSHPDIMVRSPESGEGASPYWYARVIGIYHAMVSASHPDVEPKNHVVQHMEFLWVRWFGVEPSYRAGFRWARLPKIGFVEATDEYAFTFLDPSHIVRGCHLIPAFHGDRTSALLPYPNSAARILDPTEQNDWVNLYVLM